jgi:beta-aspartyl-peptidase (threonine type)
MKYITGLIILLLFNLAACHQPYNYDQGRTLGKYVLVIHGGAGTISKEEMKPEVEKQYREKLAEVIKAGEDTLKKGASALDAVTLCITMMENSPLFNAGKGAVFDAQGINEMDASIMQGKDLSAGAVASVQHIKNPILAARAVMEHSPHVLLISKGAETFAAKQGVEMVDPAYFFTERRWKSYLKVKAKKAIGEKHGTVGAVALDKQGNLVAGTSTGGMTYKMLGRVGDSPIIGAGTYADNTSCAVSCTGHGEYFMRNVVAYDVGALMKYGQLSLKEAANFIVLDKLKKQGGEGGLIAVDHRGNFTMTFNTSGMYRAYVTSDGYRGVFIYANEENKKPLKK